LGELRSVVLPDNTTIRYYQNANNQRSAKEVNGTIVQRYLWLDNTTLLGFYDQEGNLARFDYTTDRTPVSMRYKGQTYTLIHNRIGSLQNVLHVKSIERDSFGNVIRDSNPDLDIPIGFAGGLYDRDTRLVRFGYRDYDPSIGRWTAKDPIDFNGGQGNLYVYVGDDPINGVDPSGEYWEYSQRTGALWYVAANGERTLIGIGYAGTNRNNLNGRNNPDAQNIRDNGPIPQGQWQIGAQINTPNLRDALPLTPMAGTNTFGRDGFFMHGSSAQHPDDSSNGCPIFPREIRDRINNSGDNTFVVAP
jgi:RHS repeat-associated protein